MTLPGGSKPDDGSGPAIGRTGVVLRDPLPWHDLIEVVETAEDTGYEAAFVPEINGREAFSTLTGFAATTYRLALGTGVVTIASRSPITTAMAANTVHELSAGRMVLGMGTGDPRNVPRGPEGGILESIRRYVEIVRRACSGEAVQPDEVFGVVGTHLIQLFETGPPPVWLGALGDGMIRLAGEVADGVILNWCTPERVARAKELIREGAERAGRDPTAVTVSVYVRTCLGLEEHVAMQALQAMTGQYASYPSYLRQFERMGLGEESRRAARAFAEGRSDGIPESLVRMLTVLGGREEALARFAAFRHAGADLVLCYPVTALEPLSSVLGTILAAAPSPTLER